MWLNLCQIKFVNWVTHSQVRWAEPWNSCVAKEKPNIDPTSIGWKVMSLTLSFYFEFIKEKLYRIIPTDNGTLLTGFSYHRNDSSREIQAKTRKNTHYSRDGRATNWKKSDLPTGQPLKKIINSCVINKKMQKFKNHLFACCNYTITLITVELLNKIKKKEQCWHLWKTLNSRQWRQKRAKFKYFIKAIFQTFTISVI